jgi:uncharacterized protein YecT (DUF1311 family)
MGWRDMRFRAFAMLIFSLVTATHLHGAKNKACWDAAVTQLAMNECAAKDLNDAVNELNRVYEQIKERNLNDKVFVDRLEAAQHAWVVFRDAEMEAIFPNPDKRKEFGSAYPMCYDIWEEQLTADRTKQLQKWLIGKEEGDACGGSLPVRLESTKRTPVQGNKKHCGD